MRSAQSHTHGAPLQLESAQARAHAHKRAHAVFLSTAVSAVPAPPVIPAAEALTLGVRQQCVLVQRGGGGREGRSVCDTEREIMFEEVSKNEGELRLSSASVDFLFYFSIQSKVTSSFETCAAHLKISTARKFPTAGL